MTFSNIIESILTLFGISQAPETVSELFWDMIIIFVGLFVVKYIMICVFSLMKHMTKL